MTSVLPRTFGALSLLVGKPEGLSLGEIAVSLEIPKSAAHRTLATLVELGYASQSEAQGRYHLGVRFLSHALKQLENIPVVALAGPLLEHLAEVTGELVRLGLPDGDSIVWVAKRQGASSGLKFDSDSGSEAKLVRTSTGFAWLSTMPRERARSLIEAQGFNDVDRFGPAGPISVEEALAEVDAVREAGYSFTDSAYELGLSALAVPIGGAGEAPALGVLVVAGPSVRLTRERALEILPELLAAADELARAGAAEENGSAEKQETERGVER